MGIKRAMVPQLVPVEKAVNADKRKRVAGRIAGGKFCESNEDKSSPVCKWSQTVFRDQDNSKIEIGNKLLRRLFSITGHKIFLRDLGS